MLVELVLVVAVLSLAGVAIYQASAHRASNATLTASPAPAGSAVGLANSAAAISETESATDAKISASAESSAAAVDDMDTDMSNLGGSTNANAY